MSKFKPGESGNPAGRPKGSRNKLTEDFVSTLYADFKEHGEGAIKKMRKEDNTQYVKMIASIIPKDHNIKLGDFDDLPIDELIRRANELGSALGILGAAASDQEKERPQQTH